jgi:hypothetical protein
METHCTFIRKRGGILFFFYYGIKGKKRIFRYLGKKTFLITESLIRRLKSFFPRRLKSFFPRRLKSFFPRRLKKKICAR